MINSPLYLLVIRCPQPVKSRNDCIPTKAKVTEAGRPTGPFPFAFGLSPKVENINIWEGISGKSHRCITTLSHHTFVFVQSPSKEPCQTSQTSLERDHSPKNTSTPSPSTPVPSPRKAEEAVLKEEQPGPAMVVPVPLPRQNVPPKAPEQQHDKLADEVILESEKSESEASTKTSNSDSGIEDGKSTPTSEEEKVAFVLNEGNILTVVYS